MARTSRYISGFSCEKGMVESKDAMEALVKERRKIMKEFPNLVDLRGTQGVQAGRGSVKALPEAGTPIEDAHSRRAQDLLWRDRAHQVQTRAFQTLFARKRPRSDATKTRVGDSACAQHVLAPAPFFRTYFEVLGVRRVRTSSSAEPSSSEEMFAEGGKYGSVDPCYPSKVAQAHIFIELFCSTLHVQSPFDIDLFSRS